MEPIYSMTTLQRNPSQVKDAARDSVVRITEQGAGAYVFCSEKAFERRIAQEREDAAFEARLSEAVGCASPRSSSRRSGRCTPTAFSRGSGMR